MSNFEIHWDKDKVKQTVAFFGRFTDRLEDQRDFWHGEGKDVVEDNFSYVWGLGQSDWPPLNPQYRARKAQTGKSTKKLVATGKAKRQMQNLKAGGGSNSYIKWSKSGGYAEVGVGKNIDYMLYHDVGAGHNPKREWLYLVPMFWNKLLQAHHAWHFYAMQDAAKGNPDIKVTK